MIAHRLHSRAAQRRGRVAKAAEACAEAGDPSRAITIMLDVEAAALRSHHAAQCCKPAASVRRVLSGSPALRFAASTFDDEYLTAERDLVAAVDAAGGAVPLPDGRTVTVGSAEFDALLGERRKRAWVIIRKQAPMPARR
jgi:hypothetical protein